MVQGGADRSGTHRIVPALLWLIERLSRKHEVHVFALRHETAPLHYALLGAEVHDLGGAGRRLGPGLLRLAPRLLRWLSRFGPFDLFHAYRGGGPGLLAALASVRAARPLVLTLDGGELVGLREIGYGLQLRRRDRAMLGVALRRAQVLTVGSDFMRGLAQSQGWTPQVIPWGVDTRVFTPDTNSVEGPPWRLVHVASLNEIKDPSTLLRALRHIVDARGDVQLDVVGEDRLAGATQRLSAVLNLDRHVRFHGFLPTADVVPLVQAAHLMLMSSRHDAAPVAVLEAAACGVPTVGTSVGHVADGAGVRSLAVPVGDDRALADAVLALLADPPRRRGLAGAALGFARAFDSDWTAARFEALYAGLTPSARG